MRRVHERVRRELTRCGPLDDNPANVMHAARRRLVVVGLFYADGLNLYAAAVIDPNLVAARTKSAYQRRRWRSGGDVALGATGRWGDLPAVAGAAAATARGVAAGAGRAWLSGPALVPYPSFSSSGRDLRFWQ
ncbi:MAG TPA: hypothetical protein VFM54_23605 [Micromonosporaceae bacterium]|nr:hypothetical protein [Micromonosporaceae bacterium]